MADVHPFPKSQQLARGERRYKRKVASPKQWQALSAAKRGPCRVCSDRNPVLLELHHLVSRQDHGDDLAENLVPLCRPCHDAITRRVETIGRLLLSRLSDAEYAYLVMKGGGDYAERAYGVSYEREPTVASSSGTGHERPWVVRLGSYLRIFGFPRGIHAAQPEARWTLDSLEAKAKEREAKHGRR